MFVKREKKDGRIETNTFLAISGPVRKFVNSEIYRFAVSI
jgi:hypothetical protein